MSRTPPTVGDSGIVDLSALRRGDRSEMTFEPTGRSAPFHANDVQPSVDSDGTVILAFRFLRTGQEPNESEPLEVALPAGLLGALLPMIPTIMEASVEAYARQATNLGQYVAKIKGAANLTGHGPQGV